RSGHVLRPAGQAAKAGKNAGEGSVARKPVHVAHIGKEPGKALGEKIGKTGEMRVGGRGKSGKVTGFGKDGRIVGKEMIVQDVRERSGIQTIFPAKIGFRTVSGGVRVGKAVDRPMQGNACPDPQRKFRFPASFYK